MSFDENFGDFAINYNLNKLQTKFNMAISEKQPSRKLKNKNKNNDIEDDINEKFFEDIFIDDDSSENSEEEINCPNPNCNHEPVGKGENIIMPQINKIETIDDIIYLGSFFHCKKNTHYYQINLKILYNLIAPLTELKNMIGMKNVKESIVNQIVFFLQNIDTSENKDMLHTVITGSPGCGKTELGKILGKVYKAMGILKHGKLNIVSRADLIGQYLGHTAIKTKKVIENSIGGVLFIDEAYSLGNPEGRDSFSKEAIDTLNQYLSERRDFLCIIAGYKDALETCFFKYNEGLKRRFTFRYNIDTYTPEELKEIFFLKIKNENWKLDCTVLPDDTPNIIMTKHTIEQNILNFFINNITNFPNFGGDIETLFLNCKIHHSRRVLFLDQNQKILTMQDIMKGFESYLKNRQYVEDREYIKRINDSLMLF